ncbi:MAG: ABC transporter permease subunit, partial [Pseudomonadota bacterium]
MRRTFSILMSNPLSVIGLILVGTVVFSAVFADFIAPFPEHRGAVVDFSNFNQPPHWPNIMGTDLVGRDLFSRIVYAYRISLMLAVVVLAIAVPIGVTVGLAAGYLGGWAEYILMRLTDVFLSIPPLVLAMSIMGVLEPTLTNGMLAVTTMWWPWY